MSEERNDTLRLLKEKMPEEETLYDLAELFKVFGDSTRMRILCAVNPPEAIRKILACLGMPIRAPPIAPALIEWGDGSEDIPVYSDAYA